MAHSFTVKLSDEASRVLKRVDDTITGGGGRFEGDTSGGAFSGKTVVGMIKGQYSLVSEDEIKITIIDKPFIVPYGKIEDEIRKYFA